MTHPTDDPAPSAVAPSDDGHDHDPHDDHEGPLSELVTVRDWVRYAVTRCNEAEVHCGHGCDNTFDEAVWLVLATLRLPLDRLEPFLDACVTSAERPMLLERIEQRSTGRMPTAYLVGEAWLHGWRFRVTQDVIVPRSFIAGLLAEGALDPWLGEQAPRRILDLCTGSGCLAIIAALCHPDASVDAVDIDAAALGVARGNVADYRLNDRLALHHGDLFAPCSGRRYDLILSNPPYVTTDAVRALPPEYLHEPAIALGAGDDGMDVVRRLLADAAHHLTDGGVLVVEVGHNRAEVEAAFPDLPATWLECDGMDDMVFVVGHDDLTRWQMPDGRAVPAGLAHDSAAQ